MSELLWKRTGGPAHAPTKGHPSDAGWDLRSTHVAALNPQQPLRIFTGIAVHVPEGCVGLIAGRSSLALKGVGILGGVIDHGYTGEVAVIAVNHGQEQVVLEAGSKVAQLLVLRLADLDRAAEVPVFGDTERGDKGFGSTGA